MGGIIIWKYHNTRPRDIGIDQYCAIPSPVSDLPSPAAPVLYTSVRLQLQLHPKILKVVNTDVFSRLVLVLESVGIVLNYCHELPFYRVANIDACFLGSAQENTVEVKREMNR